MPPPTGTRRTAEGAGILGLRKVADGQTEPAAEGEMMRLGALSRDVADVAEVFCPRRFPAGCSLFNMVFGAPFDLRTGWGLKRPAGRRQMFVSP